MTSYDQARRVYELEPCARTFEEDLWHHLQHGYVVSTPTAFAMARVVSSSWSVDDLRSPWVTDPDGDTWFIWLLAGDVGEAIGWLPFPKKFLAFERGNEPRVHRHEDFIRRLRHLRAVRVGA